jgi:prephenate dehydrogenase
MTIQISIIGLGQIGTSIGLALKDQNELIVRVGHDRELEVARQAQKIGAVDRVEINLPKAVRDADLVLLSLPIDEIKETMEVIAEDLKESAVVMDTGAIKGIVAEWADEILPEGRYYVGLTPVINPSYLHETDTGIEAAREDLFRGGLIAIVAPPSTHSEAVKLASDLTRLLGATALFVDPSEMDGLMAATHWLPQLLAAGLLNATVDQPGWHEGRKMAGRPYAEATGPVVHLGEAHTISAAALFNRENILRVLDSTIAALSAIRNDIDQEDEEALDERLKRARLGREKWWQQRQKGDWLAEEGVKPLMPEKQGILERLLGIRSKPKPKN